MKGCAFVLVAALAVNLARAADHSGPWPQFRGPDGAGIAEHQNPPVEVGTDKNVKWRVPAPSGFSSPIVAGDLLVLTAFDDGKLYTIGYRRGDGGEAWRAHAPADHIEAFHATEGSPAASTPATDGQHVVSYFGSCGLFCYDLTGKELWRKPMPMATTMGDFGTGVSPILVDGTVILVRDEMNDPAMLAFDVATGDLKWKHARQSLTSYCTPIIWNGPTGKQIISAGYGRLVAYDFKTGGEEWYVSGMPAACCASPVTADGKVFFAGWSPGDAEDKDFKLPAFDDLLQQGDANGDGKVSREESEKTFLKGFFNNNDRDKDGFLTREEWTAINEYMAAAKNSAFAVKAGGKGDVSTSHLLWKKKKGLPYVPSAILYEGQYVLVKDGGLVTAYDAQTGDEIYAKRAVAPGRYYASPVAAQGRIYFAGLDDGAITVIQAGGAEPKTLAKNPPLGERIAATPAIADDTLYVRTEKHLYAFGASR